MPLFSLPWGRKAKAPSAGEAPQPGHREHRTGSSCCRQDCMDAGSNPTSPHTSCIIRDNLPKSSKPASSYVEKLGTASVPISVGERIKVLHTMHLQRDFLIAVIPVA